MPPNRAPGYMRRWWKTPKGRITRNRYRKSPAGRAARRRWITSLVGKAYRAKEHKKIITKLRLAVLSYYSRGEIKCACCKDIHLEFLTIDHKDGGGRKHRKQVGGGSTSLYRWIIKNKYPPTFQILCFNCNAAKHIYGKCPHKKRKRK